MNKTINEIRLFLFTCSGEDNFILKRCKWGIQRRFAQIGFFVLLIFFGCFLSATLFTLYLFEGALWLDVLFGIIWGAIIVNIYLLLLHTISPAIIPLSTQKKKGKGSDEKTLVSSFPSLSMFLRMGFMMLLAVIIAQPFNVAMLSSSVKSSIEKHKVIEKVRLYVANNDNLIIEEIQNLKDFNHKIEYRLSEEEKTNVVKQLIPIKNKISEDNAFLINGSILLKRIEKIENGSSVTKDSKLEKEKLIQNLNILLIDELASDDSFESTLNSVTINGKLKNDFDTLKINLSNFVVKKTENYNTVNALFEESNFYVKTIQLLLHENPFSWIITILVCLVFLLPIYLKYKVRDISTKLFFEDNKEDVKLIKLRSELINTSDFKWLEKKIKSINIRDIRTSDYYFQRMLIEHRIILDEYDDTKKKFSEILTTNIKKYNENSKSRLNPLLEKLKKVNSKRHLEFETLINNEYKDEVIIKYEYWLDMPFRTKREHYVTIPNTEVGLLDFVYNRVDDEEIAQEN